MRYARLAPKKSITTGPTATGHRCHNSNRKRSFNLTTGEDQREGPSNTPEQSRLPVIAATKTSLLSIVVAAQATTRKHRIAHRAPADRNVMCVQPQAARMEAISSRRRKEEAHMRTTVVARPNSV
jgi:hypothetical protein